MPLFIAFTHCLGSHSYITSWFISSLLGLRTLILSTSSPLSSHQIKFLDKKSCLSQPFDDQCRWIYIPTLLASSLNDFEPRTPELQIQPRGRDPSRNTVNHLFVKHKAGCYAFNTMVFELMKQIIAIILLFTPPPQT
ncbi:hypothetical protein Droror1_Dr00018340 [Drosera rotundifolia]